MVGRIPFLFVVSVFLSLRAAAAAGPETIAVGRAYYSQPTYGRECEGVAAVAMDSVTNSGSLSWLDTEASQECSHVENVYYPGECQRASDGTVSCSATYGSIWCEERTILTLKSNGDLRWAYFCRFLDLFDITATITGHLTRF